MKRMISALLALFASVSFGATTIPVQLLTPTGSTSGQAIISSGASSAPTWGNVSATALTGILPVANGGTNASAASGTALDNISGFSSTGFLTRTGAGTYAFQSLTNGITYGNLAQAGANTLLGNATGSTASVTAISVAGCNGAAQALQWTNGSGFQCNSSIATSGANANITSLSGLTTPLSVSQGGSGLATRTAHAVQVGNGTGAITQVAPSTAGQALISAGASSDPVWGYPTGTLIGVQVFTSSGTYTPTPGTNSVIVAVLGGGGGGGGVGSPGASNYDAAAGGAAGAYSVGRITSAFSGVTVTVGAGGSGGAAGANAGTAGGTSSFGTLIVCGGGSGGNTGGAFTTVTFTQPPTGGTVTTAGNIFSGSGAPGGFGMTSPNQSTSFGGVGAASPIGSGGAFGVNGAGGSSASKGAGGGGAAQATTGAAAAGGNGGAGLVVVYEYN
jgi:hypothetical protein